jgi:Zn-dependent peptidase ImmA (M78 family)
MSDEFVITNEKLELITKEFGITEKSALDLFHEFDKLRKQIKDHYLAHISRVLETFFKEKTGNREFFIECKPFRINTPGQRGAVSYYSRLHKFTINYDSSLSERERRINIAHELGHLYLFALYCAEKGIDNSYKYERTTEPLSSIFGLFIISDKNHFYETLTTSGRNHSNWQEILDDFKKLCPSTK